MEQIGMDDAPGRPRIRAAQYVRMSTDYQKYSTENQAEVIAAYAERRGYSIVQTYEDSGKSGLNLDGRAELQRLLSDVRSKVVDYSAILVYDVSRWGRFQDADEAGAHEYECRRAGIGVHYCAEQFENDGSMPSAVYKSVKRIMAAAYSQDLSAKVFVGQCRLIRLGFRQGGVPGYGLRRMLIREDRTRKGELARGERKSLQTDRVVLVPGPEHEVETVRRVYSLFLGGVGEAKIATVLNDEDLCTDLGRPWSACTVRQVLRNEKYSGNNVYNRVSFKLKKARIVNQPEDWVRANGAFDALIAPDIFSTVQRLAEERRRRPSDDDLVASLRDLLRLHGKLSGLIIDEAGGPSSSTFSSRFGGLRRAYERIGYSIDRDFHYVEVNRRLRRLYPEVVGTVRQCMTDAGGLVISTRVMDLLTVNDEFTVSVVIARCHRTAGGALRWLIRFDGNLKPDLTVAVRMDDGNERIKDYYLLPCIDMQTASIRLREKNGVFLDSFRFDDLNQLAAMATPVALRRAA
jgi:DNA invertase Pin-like site-specific DNA recombinase